MHVAEKYKKFLDGKGLSKEERLELHKDYRQRTKSMISKCIYDYLNLCQSEGKEIDFNKFMDNWLDLHIVMGE